MLLRSAAAESHYFRRCGSVRPKRTATRGAARARGAWWRAAARGAAAPEAPLCSAASWVSGAGAPERTL
eukprot:2793192-Prymnesium_polylepis.1